MFYDERIEIEKGKVSRGCMILALIFALIYGSIYIANTVLAIYKPAFSHFIFVGIEAVIILFCATSLIAGALIGCLSRDELAANKKYTFYGKAGIVVIYAVAVTFSVLMPISMVFPIPTINFMSTPFDYGLYPMSVPLIVYATYSFKKREVYFNYSILESEHYYKSVFKNIGKAGLRMLALMALSLTTLSLFIIKLEIEFFLIFFISIILTYIKYYITLSAYYLLLSIAEKGSYDNETKIISRTTAVIMTIAAAFAVSGFIAKILCTSFIDAILTNEKILEVLLDFNFSLGLVISAINLFVDQIFTTAITVAIIGATYAYYEYRRAKKNKLFSCSCAGFIGTGALWLFIDPCFSMIMVLINTIVASNFDKFRNTYIEARISEAFTHIEAAKNLLLISAVMLMIYAIVKDGVLHKLNLLSIPITAAGCGVLIFMSTQIDFSDLMYYVFALCAAVYVYFAILALSISKRNINETKG